MKTEPDYRKTVEEAIRFNVILNQAVTKNSRSGFYRGVGSVGSMGARAPVDFRIAL